MLIILRINTFKVTIVRYFAFLMKLLTQYIERDIVYLFKIIHKRKRTNNYILIMNI